MADVGDAHDGAGDGEPTDEPMQLMTARDARRILGMHDEEFRRSLLAVKLTFETVLAGAFARGHKIVQLDVPSTVYGRRPYDQNRLGEELARDLASRGFTVGGTTKRLMVSLPPDGRPSAADVGAVVIVPETTRVAQSAQVVPFVPVAPATQHASAAPQRGSVASAPAPLVRLPTSKRGSS